MITKIEAVNYRSLRNISQVLSPFHVIAGPNGSGKTTFIEVPFLLGLFANEGLSAIWDATRARSLGELTFCGQGHSFQLAIEAAIPDPLRKAFTNGNAAPTFTHLRYEVEIGHQDAIPHAFSDAPPGLAAENLWLMPRSGEVPRADLVQSELDFPAASKIGRSLIHDRKLAGWRKVVSKKLNQSATFRSETTDWNFQIRNPEVKSALSTLPEDERFACANWLKRELSERVQRIALRSENMQKPTSPLKARRFAVDGSNLPQVVQDMKQDPAAYQGWLEHLQSILAIESVNVRERPEDKHLYLEVEFRSGLKAKSWQLSDGTLRLLALTLLAYIPDDGPIYLIEEPENGIHPQAIETVFQSLSAVYEGQVLVATHSPIFVAQVRPEHLLCFSKKADDATDIIRGDRHPRLRDWKGALDLSHLYAAGILS